MNKFGVYSKKRIESADRPDGCICAERRICHACCPIDMPTVNWSRRRPKSLCSCVVCTLLTSLFIFVCICLHAWSHSRFLVSLQIFSYTHIFVLFWVVAVVFIPIFETRHRCFSLFSPLFACGVISDTVYVCIRLSSYLNTISNQKKKKENFVSTENCMRSTTKTISDINFCWSQSTNEWFLSKFLIDKLIVADFKMRNAHQI